MPPTTLKSCPSIDSGLGYLSILFSKSSGNPEDSTTIPEVLNGRKASTCRGCDGSMTHRLSYMWQNCISPGVEGVAYKKSKGTTCRALTKVMYCSKTERFKWSLRELNPCPPWVLTSRSLTGLAHLLLRAGTIHYPG